MAIYGTIFYGGGGFYGPSSIDVPLDLKFYRTNTDGRYVFHWGFRPEYITPGLALADFDLQLDSVNTFDSPDLVTYDSTTAVMFQNGDVRKGFEVNVDPREEKVERTWWARVRSKIGFTTSDWSFSMPFVIPQKWEQETTENLVEHLPDFHVYNKEDLRKAVPDRKTLLYTVMNMYGKEFDQTRLENLLTTTNNFIDLCRDEQLYQNFAIFFNYVKPQLQEYVEYRECIRALMLGSLVGSTIEALQMTIRCFTGVDPDIRLVRELNDFFLSTIHESPLETPDGIRTEFSVSQQYTTGTMIVLKNGIVLTSGVDYVEDESIPGFVMSVAPLMGDELLVFYDIGEVGDPIPLVFDIADTITLTGTATFTANSTAVTGVGTLFTSELTVGDEITDAQGLVLGIVSSITDDLNLVLAQPWVGSTNSGAIKRLQYTTSQIPPSTLWDRATLAHGIIIHVNNPGQFILPEEVIKAVVSPLIPAHVKYFWEFE